MAQIASDNSHSHWPVFRSLRSFRASDLPGDLIAGLTLAAITIHGSAAVNPRAMNATVIAAKSVPWTRRPRSLSDARHQDRRGRNRQVP